MIVASDAEIVGLYANCVQFHNLSGSRSEIVELLGYLWGVPGHHSCWKQVWLTDYPVSEEVFQFPSLLLSGVLGSCHLKVSFHF